MKNLLVSDDVSGVETTPLLKKRNSDNNNNNNGSFFSRNISKNRNGILILSCVAFLLLGISSTAINSSSFGFGKFYGANRLGSSDDGFITLSTACSPVEKLSFDPGNWDNVGAKLITNKQNSDFAFDEGVEMTAVPGKCGQFSVPSDILSPGDQFGFYLYSKSEGNGSPIKDIGCESSSNEDDRCPIHSSTFSNSIGGPFGMESCTQKFSFGSDLSFYNRVYDGATTEYVWGSCSNACGRTEPKSCSASASSEDIEVQLTFDLVYAPASASDFTVDRLSNISSAIANQVSVDTSMVIVTIKSLSSAQLGSDDSSGLVELIVTINCIDESASKTVSAAMNSLTEDQEIAIAKSTGIANIKSAKGTYLGEIIIDWNEEEPTSSAVDDYDGPWLPCDAEVDEDGYYLVFKHDSSTGKYWSNANSNAEVKHTGDSVSDYKYSRLDEIETYGKSDLPGFQFKLEYPKVIGASNIWRQTSNPVTATARGVKGYEAISIGANGGGFKGLEYNGGTSNFIDGSIDSGYWFFSIGAYQAWGGANTFPGPSSGVDLVTLWVKTNAKKLGTCSSPTPVTTLTPASCPISAGTGDAGYSDSYRGWYDASGCGICQDYCRWVGNSGSGGNPVSKTSHGDSFWSCRKAGGASSTPGTFKKDFCPDRSNTNIRNVGGCGNNDYSARGYYGNSFTAKKCTGQGAKAPM